MGPVLHSAALPEPGGQGRPLLQGERIPTPVCALVRNDRVNFWGVIARALRGRGNPFPWRCGFYVSDGSLSFCSKRKGGKNAAKTKVLESFSRLRCHSRRSPLTSRTGMCKICTLLSYGLCGAIRWPLTRARAALTQQGYILRLPCYAQHFLSSFRRGRCLHRPLPYSLSPVGRDDHTSPPGIAPQLMKNPVIARALRARGNPFPSAPRFLCLRRLPFFLRQKKGRKERRQNQGFGILFAAEVSFTSISPYLADRDVQNLHLAFVWSLRRHPLAAHAGPRCPDAAGIHFASAVLCATFLVIVSQGTMPTSSPTVLLVPRRAG